MLLINFLIFTPINLVCMSSNNLANLCTPMFFHGYLCMDSIAVSISLAPDVWPLAALATLLIRPTGNQTNSGNMVENCDCANSQNSSMHHSWIAFCEIH